MNDILQLTALESEMPAETTAVQDEAPKMEIKVQPDTLVSETLPMMGKGMLGVFIVIAVIIAIVYILNTLTKPKENKDS